MSKVAQLKDDLAYALAATDIRILAPIPGKTAVGVEVPNVRRRIVQLGDVFQNAPAGWSPLTIWLGKDVAGKAIGADLAKMPHVLVAGTTGAGKSACVNAMLSSLLLRATPHELRLVLIDPKQVELNHYESIPHLLTPVITSPRMAANALQNLVKEMEQRYSIMSLAKTRSLIELNRSREKRGDAPLPYIVCVIDELADLMMVAPADVEDSIIRLAQKARAVGIHLVLATQSPRVDVITGMIKANVPSRIAFSVSSQTDSRVILDQNGAESLLGQGDMLFSPVGSSRLQRIQGAYIDEPQIEALTEFWRRQGEPELREDLLEEVESRTRSSQRRRRGRAQRRRGPAARGRDPAGRRDGNRLDVDAAAPHAARLHARRKAHRHARAAQRHLRLRGVQAAPGARRRRRRRALHRQPARARRHPAAAARARRAARRSGRSRAAGPRVACIAMPDIGATLREARMRARIDISEVEASTKIRAKYLRALENEEWDLLPGSTYVKSFLRTYAEALDLDAKLLVDEYKLRHERLSDVELQPINAAAPGRERRRQGPVVPRWVTIGGILAALIVTLYLLGGEDTPDDPVATTPPPAATQPPAAAPPPPPARPRRVRLRIVATAPVNVCLKAGDRTLVNGETLPAGETTAIYRSVRFRLTLGNNSARLVVNGRSRTVEPSADPIGLQITQRRGVRRLPAAQRPVCRP